MRERRQFYLSSILLHIRLWEEAYFGTQVEVPDRKSVCPDPPRWKVPMSRLSCVQNFSCVQRAFKSPQVQTLVRSKFFLCSSCVQKSPSPDFRAFQKENSCTSKLIICAFMSNLSCVQNYVQTFMRSKID